MTTENENNPSRRIDDKRPAVALEWEKPAAEAVEAPARATQWTILLTNAGHGLVHAYGQPFADVKAHQQCINVVDEAIVIELRERVAQLEAARIAYASEFPLNADGEPDVGNIHANIRAMNARLAAQPVAASAAGLEGLTDGRIDAIAKKYAGMGGVEDYRAFAREVLATQSAKQGAHADLHNAIMNIPCKRADSEFMNAEHRMLYKNGHRDARHAAAELATATQVAQESAPVAEVRDQALEEAARVVEGTIVLSNDMRKIGTTLAFEVRKMKGESK